MRRRLNVGNRRGTSSRICGEIGFERPGEVERHARLGEFCGDQEPGETGGSIALLRGSSTGCGAAARRIHIAGVARFIIGGKARKPSTRIWGGTCFTVLPAAPAAMFWTSSRRWKAAPCGKQPYGCRGLLAREAAPLGCRRMDLGEGNWLRKKEKSTRP